MWNLIILFSFLVLCVSGQISQPLQCDAGFPLQSAFEANQLTGEWYELVRAANNEQSNNDCSKVTIESNGTITNVAVNKNFRVETNAVIREVETSKFVITGTGTGEEFDFWILGALEELVIGFNCENDGTDRRNIRIWVLSKGATNTPLMVNYVSTQLQTKLGIPYNDLEEIDFSETACYELPVIPAGSPIILPGQCSNMTLQPDFNVTAFTGEWFEIGSYASENAIGTCPRAKYELVDGDVTVVNSIVQNQSLYTVSGTATLIDNSKLSVVLDVNGIQVTQELWILETDYTSYAMSYSCVNLENDQKRVYTWMLSRSAEVSNESLQLVNKVIDSHTDLNLRYYTMADQSDEACFYYPQPTVDLPVVFRGQCDDTIRAVDNFDPEKYQGLWYEIEKYPAAFQSGTCTKARYTLNNGIVDVLNSQVVDERLDTITGTAEIAPDAEGTGKLIVRFPIIPDTNLTASTNYYVLATDYTDYAFVYSCSNLPLNQRQVFSWKLSRSKELSQTATTVMNNKIEEIDVLGQDFFVAQDQSAKACFYYPDAVPGLPVVFPGQCDNDINVMSNFSLANFEGLWHEIQTYPKEQVQGQCINYQYTLNGSESLSLINSQVIDQFLSESTGVVTYANNQTDGKLLITITSNGQTVEIPFWVLHTDYMNYALAYSCSYINEDFSGIFAWKLARNKTLSQSHLTVIDSIMEPIDVLNNNYFEDIDQSDEACFYLPELEAGEPILLVGSCDTSIEALPNFNSTRYEGLWRIIQSYPESSIKGTCNDVTFSLLNNSPSVVYSDVFGELLQTRTSNVVLAADGSARLQVQSADAFKPSEYLILDTDYESYSLLYACVDINDNQRQVWSWKLSRSKDLSESANTAINQVINGVNVLNNRYYQSMDHTDAACFYYPEPNNRPVIFRGQCDENIRVVANFNAELYMGQWHDIQSYPSAFQFGSCSNANYTLTDGAVEVFNTMVVNERLETITGEAVLVENGKLNVTFPVSNTSQSVTTNYWVLDTDYTDFALVYSCRNIDEEHRQVSSWKLSRTKTLSSSASLAINAVTATVPVLRGQYYRSEDQSTDGCFYYPEPKPGVVVVFPGQCDTNLSVVQNFNLTRFEGDWHEIQAYPKEEQTGQCITHQYSVNDNSFNLLSSNVFGLALSTSKSVVTFTSNDNSAKLNIAIDMGTETIDIPFWILDTDYEDYALAYSCVNKGDDFKSIWSWKLSRSKQLSASGNQNINAYFSDVRELSNDYFEDIAQTDDACFYLPDLPAGTAVVLPGQCDENISVVSNFNATAYEGRWRLIESYPSTFQNGQCIDATYTIRDGVVDVYNTQVIDEVLDTMTGNATASADGSGKLSVLFPGAPGPSDYWILDTDYSSYSFVYSCSNLENNRRQVFSWKMSRTDSLSTAAVSSINNIIENINVLDARYYEQINQSDSACFYYPEPNNNTPVIFRGQCDESIPVVQNFDAEKYMGLWHDIQSYPSAFQFGSCSNANYTLTDGAVEVFNTMVVNERLETITGEAVLVENGKLSVTFPVSNTSQSVTTNYWVLDTDYTDYALVYSCRNIDEEHRQVSSWKLSRTKTLSSSASLAINAVTDTVPVLRGQYYRIEDQSTDSCFYYPEPKPGVVVVFPGQCDTNLSVVQNFNLTQFAGDWHEIQAYPKAEQTGQCINHQYSVNDNSFNLLSSNVFGLALSTSKSVVTFTSNDNSAKLNIAIDMGTETINIPFWILDTDYEDYALAYSCVNKGDDFKSIWSWKLSRSKQLSASGNQNINAYFSDVRELSNDYFEDIAQTDDACFYLPNLPAGTPVALPGQCDENISVVSNFNATAYEGRWRLIESYPSTFQNGQCNDATYTIRDGIVDVYNTQVIDEVLDTINGTATASADGSGKLSVLFPGAPGPSDYWILDTDYSSYSFVYSCSNLENNWRQVFSWKMSRTDSLSTAAVSSINNIIENINVLDARYYERIDQSDSACFYYPEPNNSTSVRFRGQCDESIPVLQNFDVERYMNLWHDVGSYPQEFQYGSCPNALYTLTEEGVEVYNTQIVEQLLDNINGTAVVASTDGSAKLVVSFPIAGTEITTFSPYWVLATDYNNYALVYSCVNIDAEYRRVTSWKLSRDQAGLSTAASSIIDNIVDSIPVLRNDYYVNRGQTEDACFYYPDNLGGPVVLKGQCEDNTAESVSNFNADQFTGTWHEFARFPSEFQNGECASMNFDSSTMNYTLTKNVIINEKLVAVSGPASVSDGVVSATLIDNSGVATNFDFKVLDTDYTEFALLYSCRNLDANTKQIHSWKMSRTAGQLSTAAASRIDEAVSNNVDLHPQYFESSGQALSDCFYYPDFNPLPPSIELLGPCDESIRGQANFNVSGYLGEWIEIAKYPQPFQEGTCGRAIYTPSESGVDVSNTQVYESVLLTQAGTAVVASNDGTGQLDVTFVLPNGVTNVANYYVLTTDYDNYALVYSCRNLDNGNRQVSSWKLSRSKTLSAGANTIMDTFIASTRGLYPDYYEATSQSDEDCFYVPAPSDNAVVFRGQCNESVSRVENFDLDSYVGWWHEIESYSTGKPKGDCISAQLQSSGNSIQVVNTNVFDLSAEVTTGVVTASSDGILRVTMPNGDVDEYWVLATDYNSYSLLYSCRNMDDDHRLVWSAKHSKSRQLSQEAQAAMLPQIESNQVLYRELYQSVSQNDTACFHYPEPSGQQVILPGQCDEDIPAQTDFNAVEYSGTWYQIERYPAPFEFGNCTGARYSVDLETGVVTVLNWEIVDDNLETIEGIATVSSTDGSGKLIVQLPIAGTNLTTETDLYVLKTDYITYSLVYSCSNINEYQRSIGAWKLSRTRHQTSEGESEIYFHMQTREELHAPYFIETYQSDECEVPSSALLVKSSVLILIVSAALIRLF